MKYDELYIPMTAIFFVLLISRCVVASSTAYATKSINSIGTIVANSLNNHPVECVLLFTAANNSAHSSTMTIPRHSNSDSDSDSDSDLNHVEDPHNPSQHSSQEVKTLTLNTSRFISYLHHLLETQVISLNNLKEFINELDENNKIIIPVSHNQTVHGIAFNNTIDKIHYTQLSQYIKTQQLDHKLLITLAKHLLDTKDKEQQTRTRTENKTQDPYQKMEFAIIKPGTIHSNIIDGHREITLPHSIEVMTTHVTQKMWLDIMGETRNRFKLRNLVVFVDSLKKQIKLHPDTPIYGVTFWSAIVFANLVSKKMGLQPAYNLNHIKFKCNTHPKLGNLKHQNEYQSMQIISHTSENVYLTEGFRLPTSNEQEYILASAQLSMTTNYNIFNYDWLRENSGTTMHPVAQLMHYHLPNGAKLYDVFGNAAEMSSDLYKEETNAGNFFSNYYNTDAIKDLEYIYCKTMHYNTSCTIAGSSINRHIKSTNNESLYNSFRLVRTILN